MCSPRNIASRRSATPHSLGELGQQLQGLVGDPVLRVVEVEPGALGDQALPPFRIVGEELTKVPLADLGVVLLERLPSRATPEGGLGRVLAHEPAA